MDSLAVLANKIEHLEKAHEENAAEIKLLKEKNAKVERYGWFCMGIMFVGISIVSSFESAVKYIKAMP